MKKRYLPVILLLAVILCISCGEGSPYGFFEEEPDASGESDYYSEDKPVSKTESSKRDLIDEEFGEDEKKSEEKEAGEEGPEERKKVYFGDLKLIVEDVKDRMAEIGAIADKSGGYVESSYDRYIIIRVPAQNFNAIFEQLMTLGEVSYKSIRTFDVTEYFQDLSKRLDIAARTRERLYNLLERTKDVKERLRILKEIRRLTEEIEEIKLTLETVRKLISFSRISVELVPRLNMDLSDQKETIPFPWIKSLDPFYTSILTLKGAVDFKLPDDFAVFDKEKYFFAESADGIRIKIGTVENKPEGDGKFWQKALQYHLGKFYRESELFDTEQINGILFTSKDVSPFEYFAGVTVVGDYLFVMEILFPDQKTFDGKWEKIKSALEEYKARL
ncbi:MAG: DUF4349 domain-containing protein [Spirochaetales bacterium]|nr:DUF4349 domain-containing protein [Spirochaetales bacterium]